MIIAPAPSGKLTNDIYFVFEKYIKVCGLFLTWGFFAPTPDTGRIATFVVTDSLQQNHFINPVQDLLRSHPTYIRHMDLNRYSAAEMDFYGPAIVQYLCSKYKDLDPQVITIQTAKQSQVLPEEYTGGMDLFHKKEELYTYTYTCSGE